MRHFEIGDWTDFARGLEASGQRRKMQVHLRSGCPTCRRLLNTLLLVVTDARCESAPPPAAVRGARAVFGLRSQCRSASARRLHCTSVFDSFLQPASVGTRDLQTSSRHLVFNSREFVIDTRMEYASGGHELSVAGQIVTRCGDPVPQVPTFLTTGRQILSSDFTSDLGEFCMTCDQKGHLRLCLAVGDNELIEVDLDRRRPDGVPPRAAAAPREARARGRAEERDPGEGH